MPDPALPASLAAELAELRRRLDAVERSPRLPNSSIRGGALTILNEDGTDVVVKVGDFTGPDGASDTGLYFPDDAWGSPGTMACSAPASRPSPAASTSLRTSRAGPSPRCGSS